jgi:hypothetical protein
MIRVAVDRIEERSPRMCRVRNSAAPDGAIAMTCSYLKGPEADGGDGRYFNFLTYSDDWWALSSAGRESIKGSLPFYRTSGSAPGDGSGHWVTEHVYSSGGVLVSRRVFKPW